MTSFHCGRDDRGPIATTPADGRFPSDGRKDQPRGPNASRTLPLPRRLRTRLPQPPVRTSHPGPTRSRSTAHGLRPKSSCSGDSSASKTLRPQSPAEPPPRRLEVLSGRTQSPWMLTCKTPTRAPSRIDSIGANEYAMGVAMDASLLVYFYFFLVKFIVAYRSG